MKRSGRKKKMCANLPAEFGRFSKYSRHLRRIWSDTNASFDDIAKCGYFDEAQLQQLRLGAEDEHLISSAVSYPVALVVLGRSCYAKACVINELFGQMVLPVASPLNDDGRMSWRMVRFCYGIQTEISLALPNSYELVEHLAAYDQPWRTIPRADLELEGEARNDPALSTAVLEIRMKHTLLKDDVQVVMTPCDGENSIPFDQMYLRATESTTPLLIYAIADELLSEREIEDLVALQNVAPDTPVLFVRANAPAMSELTESEQHARSLKAESHMHMSSDCFPEGDMKCCSDDEAMLSTSTASVYQELCSLGFLDPCMSEKRRNKHRWNPEEGLWSELVENFEEFLNIAHPFVRAVLQARLVKAALCLNVAHQRCLRAFILTAFDMTRDMMITPKRLSYARQQENGLYHSLMAVASHKQEEVRQLIVGAVNVLRPEILERAAAYQFKGIVLEEGQELQPTTSILQMCTAQIQDLVLGTLNTAVAEKLVGSIDCLRESFVGTLERCLASLEGACKEEGSLQASNALKQILNAAYQVEVTVKTSSSILWVLWEKMKQLVQTLPGRTPPQIDEEWKQRVASDMLDSLSEWRLARCISTQFRDRLRASHEQFQASLRHLEAVHSGRLERTEGQRLKVRKLHAPRLARYALESISLRDVMVNGMPQLGRELGRGQYGVVYASEAWGGVSPCAVKSVVPPDDKHWNDLAMEFFYTRSIPDHERIVQIRGSVIDHNYGGGSTPAVLLIMDRLQRDLYTALRVGLDWLSRLQVALDVVQGIRYLHSQGLVHRDIKLKNVLLDKHNRAKLTDLGFCKPEAMMSGSIVGTPIHMAPELFTGRYDNSVDTYAFGILFWYICAGHVKLPYIFEQCQTKDQLWSCVRKGARPERLPHFDGECWSLMEKCWSSDPQKRPLLGEVETTITHIIEVYSRGGDSEKDPDASAQRCQSSKETDSGVAPRRTVLRFIPGQEKYEMAIPGSELSYE